MNQATRKSIEKIKAAIEAAREALEIAKGEIEELASDEREKFDNLPEGLQLSERGEAHEKAADALDEAVEEFEGIDTAIDEIVAKLDEAAE